MLQVGILQLWKFGLEENKLVSKVLNSVNLINVGKPAGFPYHPIPCVLEDFYKVVFVVF